MFLALINQIYELHVTTLIRQIGRHTDKKIDVYSMVFLTH